MNAQTQRIGRYRVESLLGTGAFSIVYHAIDDRLDDSVAIKVLAENHSLDLGVRERFIAEGRVLRRINSSHVIRVYDLGETDRQQPYLVLEFARRGTLAERVKQIRGLGWRPSVSDLLLVAEPLADALQAIHQANVVHRDVNPANVLIMSDRNPDMDRISSPLLSIDDRLVLADLGLCKDLALNSGHTSAGGTQGYRPPELRSGPSIIDRRADLWSASALLVWLATGAPPGVDCSAEGLARFGVPEQLAAPLARGLADNPQDRQPDAATWRRDISTAIARWAPPRQVPVLVPAPAVDGRSSEPPPQPPMAAVAQPMSWGQKIVSSLWLLFLLPMGLTTFIGFFVVGVRENRARWLWFAGFYLAVDAVLIALILLIPTDAAGKTLKDSWQSNLAVALVVLLWFGGIVHGILVNAALLRDRNPATK